MFRSIPEDHNIERNMSQLRQIVCKNIIFNVIAFVDSVVWIVKTSYCICCDLCVCNIEFYQLMHVCEYHKIFQSVQSSEVHYVIYKSFYFILTFSQFNSLHTLTQFARNYFKTFHPSTPSHPASYTMGILGDEAAGAWC